MRIGVRTAISGLVLTSILVSAIGVHLLWWKTAEQTSQNLARTINEQIVSAVGKELASITTEAKSAHTAIRTLFLQNVLDTREADKREFVFLSQLQSQPSVSWVAFGWPDGAFFAAHKLGDSGLEMMEIATMDGRLQRRVDQYEMVTGDTNVRAFSASSSNTRGSRNSCRSLRSANRERPSFLIGTAQSSRRRIPTPTKLTHQRPISRCCRSPTALRGRRQVHTPRIRDRRTGSGWFGMGKLMR
jgi:hypothetical protein